MSAIFRRILIHACLLPCLAIRPAMSEPQIDAGAREVLNQRASFALKGSVLDESGQMVDDVSLNVTVHQYDSASMKVGKQSALHKIDGRFDLLITNATAVVLQARKDGYIADPVTFTHQELMKQKRKEISTKLAQGKMKKKTLDAEPYAPYRDLKTDKQQIEIVMRKALMTKPEGQHHYVLTVKQNKPSSGCSFSAQQQDECTLVMEPDKKTDGYRLYLVAEEGNSIRFNEPAQRVGDIAAVPSSGFVKRVQIPTDQRHTPVSFWLRRADGSLVSAFGLLEATAKLARLEITETSVVQGTNDGSR